MSVTPANSWSSLITDGSQIWEQESLFKGSPAFFWVGSKKREQLLIRVEAKLTNLRTIPRAWTLILHASPSETKKKESTRVGPTNKFEQSKEKNYPPTSLVTLLCIFCVLGRAHSCALCAPSGRRGESRRAGDGNPALLLLCSNWPQQPAAASRSDFPQNPKKRLMSLLS